MRTQIKICCIRSVDEAERAIRAGADGVGMVGARPPSPRTIPDVEIAHIAVAISPSVPSYLLTTERDAVAIAAQVASTGVNAVQIIDHIDFAESEKLAALIPRVRRVQVIHVTGHEVLELIPQYAPHVSAFLLDSGDPSKPIKKFGGTGRQHDWSISAEFVRQSEKPVVLAGGLNPDNVATAINIVRPSGVDVCSGVRTDGQLDDDKLFRFIAAVRAR